MAKKDSLSRAAEILGSIDKHKKESAQQAEKDRRDMIFSIGQGVADALKPTLNQLASQAKLTKADMADFVSKIKVETHTPDVVVPDIQVPKADITVRSPKIRVPDVVMPDEMNVKGFVQLMGVDLGNPLPVQLRLPDGNPLNLMEGLSQIVGGGGGGAARVVKISNLDEITLTSSGLTDTELRASSVPVAQASGAIWSTEVATIFGTTFTDSSFTNSDNRLRVSVETGGSGLTDAELRATSVPVEQVSGSSWSTEVTGGTLAAVTGITNSVQASIIDSSGVQYSGSNPVPATIISDGAGLALAANQLADGHNVTVDNAAGGSAVNIQDGGNSITVDGTVAVSGITDSTTAIVGDLYPDEVDTDSQPVKIGGTARTANPTAVGGGDRVSASFDDVGRALVRPVQVRDLLQTAFAAVTTGTETTLLAGASGVYHDLVYMMAANHSDAAVQVDIRQTTGGTIQMSLDVPANSTAGLSLGGATIPQDHADATWTVDLSDDTHDLDVTALFSKEV